MPSFPITIPNIFANATVSIPLAQLDTDFTTVGTYINALGNGTLQLTTGNIAALATSGFAIGNTVSNVLVANVALNNNTQYFDGPAVLTGVTGTWFASGSVNLRDSASGPSTMIAKLWDGSTVVATGVISSVTNNQPLPMSGVFTNPAGKIRISVRDASANTGSIDVNNSGDANATLSSIITAIRIA